MKHISQSLVFSSHAKQLFSFFAKVWILILVLSSSTEAQTLDNLISSVGLDKTDTVIMSDSLTQRPLTLEEIIRRNETYFEQLQVGRSRLLRVYDTTYLSVEIPIIERIIERINESFESAEISFNLQYLNELENLMDGYGVQVNRWQNEINKRTENYLEIGRNIVEIRNSYNERVSFVDSVALPILNLQWDLLYTRLNKTDSVYRHHHSFAIDLQSKLSGLVIGINDVKDEVREKRQLIRSRLLQKESPYIWQKEATGESDPILSLLTDSLTLNKVILRSYLNRNISYAVLIIFLGIGLYIWFTWLIKTISREKEFSTVILERTNYLTFSPLICTFLSILTLTPYILPYPPNTVIFSSLFGMAACSTILLRQVLFTKVFRLWVFMVLSLVIFGVSNQLIEHSFQERFYLIGLSVIGIAIGLNALHLISKKPDHYPQYLIYLIYLYLSMQSLSVLFQLFGRFSLGKLLAVTSTLSTMQAISLYMFVLVIMEALYLQSEVAQSNQKEFTNYLNYKNIYRRLNKIFITLAVFMWVYFLTLNLSIDDYIFNTISTFLSEERTIGNSSFTFGSILVFILVIWVASVLAKNIAYFATIKDSEKADLRDKRLGSSILLIRLAVLIVGFFAALTFSGISLDKLAIVLGALSVGIGFGLQTIVNNLVSGIILAFERPIQIGDAIEVGGRSGVVKEVGIRSSTLQSYDGSEVIIPNGDLLSQHLINWTLSDRKRRIEIIIGVAYGSNLKLVQEVLLEVMKKNEILSLPEPRVFVHNFADSAVEFRLLFWVSNFDTWLGVKNQVMLDTYLAFDASGIEIPFPQRDIHVRTDISDKPSDSKEEI
ncbi:mechanosensitive ion channel family protein [Lunatibacter salilacus]|uniref:mechanosensitive ion channel family protein n=1 Tax=Lunatibacter salilacus TaxID=2483804 RepID=UPI00131C577C|nr:mechanosensitive ion channel domain-containing protein [Lunatibacter salilacus]